MARRIKFLQRSKSSSNSTTLCKYTFGSRTIIIPCIGIGLGLVVSGGRGGAKDVQNPPPQKKWGCTGLPRPPSSGAPGLNKSTCVPKSRLCFETKRSVC